MFCFQDKNKPVAIKCITKKNLAKSQSLLSKEIKILKVRYFVFLDTPVVVIVFVVSRHQSLSAVSVDVGRNGANRA